MLQITTWESMHKNITYISEPIYTPFETSDTLMD